MKKEFTKTWDSGLVDDKGKKVGYRARFIIRGENSMGYKFSAYCYPTRDGKDYMSSNCTESNDLSELENMIDKKVAKYFKNKKFTKESQD